MIGRVIDKYKIVEEVGQGGMSVVYKGMDTTLNREVAVKVLHPHLASSSEARERFEREAHAVAKLRHENILEIYDYSGTKSPDSYIVTELIRGRTLRSFIADHAIAFPEIAALIGVEICRALAHAHSLGVLHRDIKPENIMIREDGRLKLMDFGIAHIVDSHRLTITGQLLGSPAYMSPEHVEGRALDFRTDVFSIGILLYQLATGELPFKGRNPHEILKRIAECRYLDPRVVNPLVADRLARLLARALARLPEDRYPDVALLLEDLQGFLAEVELTDARSELERFFEKPLLYEQELRGRLVVALIARGREELARKRFARALELWNRVLTIDPENGEVLRLIDRLSKRRRIAWGAVAGLGLLALSGSVALAWGHLRAQGPPEASEAPQPQVPPAPLPAPPPRPATPPAPAAVAPAAHVVPAPAAPADAGVVAEVEPPPPTVEHRPHRPASRHERAEVRPTAPPVPTVPVERRFALVPTPQNAWYSIDGGKFTQNSMGRAVVTLGPGVHKIVFHHPLCDDVVIPVGPGEAGHAIVAQLKFKPTRVRARCDRASVITINGSPYDNIDILDFERSGTRQVTVEFTIPGEPTQTRNVRVKAGDPEKVVTCD